MLFLFPTWGTFALLDFALLAFPVGLRFGALPSFHKVQERLRDAGLDVNNFPVWSHQVYTE